MTASETVDCDVLVIGSGAGGLATAVTAAYHKLTVIVVEKAEYFGGTSAWSGGAIWIPGNSFSKAVGVKETVEQAREYLRADLGNYYDEARIESYLSNGPAAVDFFHQNTSTNFVSDIDYPDYHPDVKGSVDGGRTLWAKPFDGHELGKDFAKLRPPMKQYTFFGMGVGAGMDYRHFLNMRRSFYSVYYVGKRILRHFYDVVRYGRGARLFNGNALIARLAKSAIDLNIPIWLESPAQSLIVENDRVVGAIVRREGKDIRVFARKGVVLASGGFPQNKSRVGQLFSPAQSYSAAPTTNIGDGLRMAEELGAVVKTDVMSNAYSAPLSKAPMRDGSIVPFPHFVHSAKPGFIAVTNEGVRFTNESNSYHDIVQDMIRHEIDGEKRSAFIICDHWAIRRYGLGHAKPWPLSLRPYLKSGYILKGDTIEDLAAKAGIDPVELRKTVDSFNIHAGFGFDPDFRKGKNTYNRFQGDKTHLPNPCLHPLTQAPYYAVKIYAGILGTMIGLKTDEKAQVLKDGQPIPGLFAAGNDMANVFGGGVPGGGVTLGSGMIFGYLIGRRLAGHTQD